MIRCIIKWYRRRQRAMRIGMKWIKTEETLVAGMAHVVRNLNSFDHALRQSKLNHPTREPQIVVDSRTWTGRY